MQVVQRGVHHERAPLLLRPAPDEVHVWSAWAPGPGPTLESLRRVLTPGERARADRFMAAAAHDEYVTARALLRLVLAAYLESEPGALGLEASRLGKPRLMCPAEPGATLAFNVSHSAGAVVLAFAEGREVGVDIERATRDPDAEGIASRFFAAEECARFFGAGASERDQLFREIWVRKEAVSKAVGAGLSLDLGSFSVVGEDGEMAPVVSAGDSGQVSVVGLTADTGSAAAVALAGVVSRPRVTMPMWSSMPAGSFDDVIGALREAPRPPVF